MPSARPPAITAHGLSRPKSLGVPQDRVAVGALQIVTELRRRARRPCRRIRRLVLALAAQVLAEGAHVLSNALRLLARLRGAVSTSLLTRLRALPLASCAFSWATWAASCALPLSWLSVGRSGRGCLVAAQGVIPF